jgi:hypothetical protein
METRRRHRRAFSISHSGMPFERAHASTVASPYWATAFLTAQQGTAYAGIDINNAATTTQTLIICRA